MSQVVGCLLRNCEALSINLNTTKNVYTNFGCIIIHLFIFKIRDRLSVVAHSCNYSIWGLEVGGSQVLGQLEVKIKIRNEDLQRPHWSQPILPCLGFALSQE
jgi:hypothetical protein